KRTEALTHHRHAAAVDFRAALQLIDDRTDHRPPSVGNGKSKSGLSLSRPIDRQRGHATAHESLAPGVEFFLAGVKSGQKDRDRTLRLQGKTPRLERGF